MTQAITFVLRRLRPLAGSVLKRLGLSSCSQCSHRFQTLLRKLGFIICYHDGYALPVEPFDCRESPFQVAWDEIRNHHTEATFKALEMYAQYHDPKYMESVRDELWRKREFDWRRRTSSGMDGPVVGLRGRVIPVTREESRHE